MAWKASLEQWAFRLLWASVFCSAFTLPVGRVLLLLSMITLIYRAVRGGGRIRFPFPAWCWFSFAVVAVLASAFGVNPSLSFSKISKLIWFMGIPVAATLAISRARIIALLRAYVYGAGVLALDILVLRTWAAWQAGNRAVAQGKASDLWWEIIDRGSMTHGQVLMVALIALTGLLILAPRQRAENRPASDAAPVMGIPRLLGWFGQLTLLAAFILNFKRGSWASAGIVIMLFYGLTGHWRRVLLLLIAVGSMVMLPPVQRRLSDLRSELSLGHGGRLVMWTKIAPTLIREHPFGLGYRALDENLMQETARRHKVRVEKNRNHLHSNLLQITASLGWAGLAVYMVWMGNSLIKGIRQGIRGADVTDRRLGLTLAMMLSGLFINGLVEYNYGDAELVLVYGLLFGLLAANPASTRLPRTGRPTFWSRLLKVGRGVLAEPPCGSNRMGLIILLFCTAFLQPALALGPHELLVLANQREPDSVAVAKAYMQMRQIPDINLVELDLGPSGPGGVAAAISPEAFTSQIWTPVQQALRDRGIAAHIQAWAYSTHFPYRINTTPLAMSLQGLTFVRNRIPPSMEIAQGTYVSSLFAGPDGPGKNGFGPQSFDTMQQLLRDEMPLPNMTLGYIGTQGNTVAEVLAMLRRGSEADGTQPTGTVYYVVSDDIRSKARLWQFASAAEGLRRMGVNALVTNSFPQAATDIIGIMSGVPVVNPAAVGGYLPGAMAEHLTSFAATFDHPTQTKLSRWIAAGASGSAGTVCEPMSYWSKFPHARFFNHYRMGCTMIESFYQAIRCPLQLMLVGDPLTAPWAPRSTLQIKGIEPGESLRTARSIDLNIQAPRGVSYSRFIYLVDGKIIGEGQSFSLDPAEWAKGKHTLRAVAYTVGFVRSQAFDTVRFVIP